MLSSWFHDRPHNSTRQYGRLVRDWVAAIGFEPSGYRRTRESGQSPLKFTVKPGTCEQYKSFAFRKQPCSTRRLRIAKSPEWPM